MAGGGEWLKRAAFLLAAAFLVLSCIRGIWAVDFWWQLAAGRLIAENGIPHVDVFSYPSLGNAWYEMRWLYCLTIYGLVTGLGFWAVVVLKTLVVCATFVLAFFTGFWKEIWQFCLAIGVMAVFASSIRFFDRPELWSYLFLALYIWIVQTWRRGGGFLWLLPLLQILWTNSHTLFLIGPGVAFACLLAVAGDTKRRSPAALVFLATCAACFANPYGWQGVLFPLQLLSQVHGTVFKDNIQELRGPFSGGITSVEVAVYGVLIGIAALGFVLRRFRIDPFLGLTAAAMLYLSLTGIRNVPLFCIVAMPLIFDCYKSSAFVRNQSVRTVLVSGTIGACVFMLWAIGTRRWIVWRMDVGAVSFGLAPYRYPIDAVAFMESRKLEEPVYNTMSEGSYLIWAGFKSYIDPRLEVAGGKHFAESQDVNFKADSFHAAERKYGFMSALVDLNATANETLTASPDWNLVYFDAVAAVYSRRDSGINIETRARELYAQLVVEKGGNDSFLRPLGLPAPALKLAKFMFKQGRLEWASRFAQLSLEIYPRTRGASAILGQVAFDLEQDDVAIPHLLRAANESPKNQDVLRALGIAYRRKGEIVKAAEFLQRAVDAQGSAENWISLADVLAIGGDADNAVSAYRNGLKQDAARAGSWLKLSTLLALQGKRNEAITALKDGIGHNDSDFQLLSRLAALLAESGNIVEAKAYASKALTIKPKDKAMLELSRRY